MVYFRHWLERFLNIERAGTIIGDHEVILAGKDEVITLSHSALSREMFASGALRAAMFICGKEPGMYSMKDLLG